MSQCQVRIGRIFLGLAVLTFGCFFSINLQAGVVDLNTTVSKAQAWDGFGQDFEPEWKGKTTEVTKWPSGMINDTSTWIFPGTSSGTLQFGGSDATLLATKWQYSGTPGHWETRSTVQKISSSSNSKVANSTLLRIGGDDFTADNDSGGSAMARYAELVSPQGDLLANASSIAYKTAEFDEDDFSGSGRVSSFAILSTAALTNHVDQSNNEQLELIDQGDQSVTEGQLAEVTIFANLSMAALTNHVDQSNNEQLELIDQGDQSVTEGQLAEVTIFANPWFNKVNEMPTGEVEAANVSATGQSWFDASYELDQDTAFSLELDIARVGNVAISFSATDTVSDEEVFSLPLLEPEGEQTISISGLLEAGTYKFSLNCETTAELDSSGNWQCGGQAEFDFSFDLEEEYMQVWVPGTGMYAENAGWETGDFDNDGKVDGSDTTILAYNWQFGVQTMQVTEVPEPSMLAMLIFGGLSFLLIARRRRK